MRKWVLVTLGVLGVLAVLAIAMFGAGVYLISRNVRVAPTTPAAAAEQFEQTLGRFAGQKPLIRMDNDDWIVLPETRVPDGARQPIESLQVLVWDPDESKLARVRVPFWLLRLAGPGSIRLSSGGGRVDLRRMRVTMEDIEHHGPGLILDHVEPDSTRVLVWAQ